MDDRGPSVNDGGLRGWVRRHRGVVGAAAVVAVGLAAFVVLWFQPQKLFIDERVNEAAPTAAAGGGAGATPSSPGTGAPPTVGSDPSKDPVDEPPVLAAGDFRDLEHATTGRALILELPDGRRVLRLDDLETSNGPDLRVYLSEVAAGDDPRAYGERFVDLGPLKGNIGDQNYDIPADLDVAKYRSAVIWCVRFTVGFGVAPLDPP